MVSGNGENVDLRVAPTCWTVRDPAAVGRHRRSKLLGGRCDERPGDRVDAGSDSENVGIPSCLIVGAENEPLSVGRPCVPPNRARIITAEVAMLTRPIGFVFAQLRAPARVPVPV